ncbi:response regulator [Nocardioides antri]|uniref:Response regulator n=1 Tax=Nocardioides antri TaxID=2607659 RepID=A0A5B1MA35_9ACTN|nr:response regulator [Nocardioides antri]KAA1429306.1 response regulator [Nocardioides antri]
MSVLIVDDHPAFREYLRSVLEDDGFDVVGDVPDAEQAVATAAAVHPDLVLLDIHLGDGPDGFEVARRLADLPAPPGVIITSSRSRSAYDDRIATAPVLGFVPKDELTTTAIRELARLRRTIRVAIAEDSVLFREGIVRVLGDLGFIVVGQVSDGDELLDLLETQQPDVVIVDIRMPPSFTSEGVSTASAIAERFPDVGVMVLSHYLTPDFALRLLQDQPSHRGYLLKDRVGDLPSFAAALTRVANGGLAVDPQVVTVLMHGATDPLSSLTEREHDVLQLMAAGLSNDGIATELVVSPRTVEAHVGRILDKLGIERCTGQNPRVGAVLRFLDQSRAALPD